MDEDALDINEPRIKAEEASPYRWVIVGMLMMMYGAGWGTSFILGILLPSISDTFSLSPSDQGLLGSSVVWANLLLAIPLGWWLSRYRVKNFTIVVLLLGAFFMAAQGWALNFALLLLARVFFGLTLTAREPARAILTRQWIPPREINLVNALLNAAVASTIGVVLIISPFILSGFGDDWRKTLYVFALVSLIPALLWMVLGRERRRPKVREEESSQEESPLRVLIKYRQLWIANLAFFGNFVAYFALATFWPTYVLEKFDLSLQAAGLILGINGFMQSVGGMIAVYLLIKKDIRKGILITSGLVLTSSTVGMLLTGSFPLLIVLSILQGLGWAFIVIAMTVPFELPGIKPRELAVAVASSEMSMWAGGAVGPVLVGWVHQASGSLFMALFIPSLFLILVSLSGVLLPRRRPVTVALE